MEKILSLVLIDPVLLLETFAAKNDPYILEAIRQAMTQKTIELGITIEESMVDEVIRRHLETLTKTWKGIIGTDTKQLGKIISEGIDQGYNMQKIAREISSRYNPSSADFMNRWRANTIARTESARAANYASHESLGYGGVGRTVWVSAGDEQTRVAHVEAEGQEVDLNQAYIVSGESLLYPGDPNGSPGNIINCRCVEVPSKAYQ